MTNTTHLDVLNLRLSHERTRLAAARSENERQLRAAWVAQTEREIADELAFVGKDDYLQAVADISDDELLAELLR